MVLYKRDAGKNVDFFASYQIHQTRAFIPDASIILTQYTPLLLIQINDAELLNITESFHFLAEYDTPGNFKSITVTATNGISSATKDLTVEFENVHTGGLKWYTVFIIVLLVIIAIVVALGLYLRMKKRRQDSKKVSLFTENEEIDEKI